MDDQVRLRQVPNPAVSTATRPGSSRRRIGRRGWLLLALCFGIAVGAVWWKTQTPIPVSYVTAAVTRGAVTRSVTATGTVNPELTIIVGSYVSGVIQELYCDYNTKVKAGQICAKIDPRPYQASFDQYSGQLLRDQALLDKDRADLARYQKLMAENSIARQQAENQLYVVRQDEGTVKIDEALVENAKLNLGYTNIVSPVDGTVVSRNVTQGQTVAASFQTPTLFLIASDLTKMQVDSNISESDIGGVKNGDKATFTVDAYPRRVFEGRVAQVRQSPQTVQNVVTFDAVVSVNNRDLALMPGMTASMRIVVQERSDVLRVPNQALRYRPAGFAATAGAQTESGAETHLWVLRNGRPVSLDVTVGLDDETFTEIVKAEFEPGDQVIVGEDLAGVVGRSGPPVPRF